MIDEKRISELRGKIKCQMTRNRGMTQPDYEDLLALLDQARFAPPTDEDDRQAMTFLQEEIYDEYDEGRLELLKKTLAVIKSALEKSAPASCGQGPQYDAAPPVAPVRVTREWVQKEILDALRICGREDIDIVCHALREKGVAVEDGGKS